MRSSDEDSYVRNKARAAELEARRKRIRELNDTLRTRHAGGMTTITSGVQSLPCTVRADILDAVRTHDTFTDDDDPYQEHDFGSVDVGDVRVFWKIDCYDKQLEFGSPDAADPAVTMRVLTIMLASEY